MSQNGAKASTQYQPIARRNLDRARACRTRLGLHKTPVDSLWVSRLTVGVYRVASSASARASRAKDTPEAGELAILPRQTGSLTTEGETSDESRPGAAAAAPSLIDLLPIDLLILVLTHPDLTHYRDLVRLVCRRWREIIDQFSPFVPERPITVFDWGDLEHHQFPFSRPGDDLESRRFPFSRPRPDVISNELVVSGDFPRIRRLRASGCDWGPGICYVAAAQEQFDILRWAYTHGASIDQVTASSALQTGRSDIFEWVMDHDHIVVDEWIAAQLEDPWFDDRLGEYYDDTSSEPPDWWEAQLGEYYDDTSPEPPDSREDDL